MSPATCDRRTTLQALGAGIVGAATLSLPASATQDAVEYTLIVEDADGNEVGSTTVTDEFDVAEYGGHVTVGSLGDRLGDGDHGYIDHIRFADGTIIVDWEEQTFRDYFLSNEPTGGAAPVSLVEEPVAHGTSVLEVNTSQGWTGYTSKEEVLELQEGDAVEGALRHETDESSTYAMKTGFRVGDDASGTGGIDVKLVNPGTQRTPGAHLQTPNANDVVQFEPVLEQFYTLRVEIGDVSSESNTGDNGTQNASEDDDSGGDALPGFGVLAGVGALGVASLGALSRRLGDE